jgi:hypothetical protein
MLLITNLAIVGLILGLTYALTSEGLWGAALMFFNVLFAGMIAFNFCEPLAVMLDETGIGWGFSETLVLSVLFIASVVALRLITETIAPAQVKFPMPIYQAGRFIFGIAGAVVTTSIILMICHTAPVHKKLFTVINYDTKPPFNLGLDHQWLGFFQYETGMVFANYGSCQLDPYREFGMVGGNQRVPVAAFDPRAEWLLTHQEARPYGEGNILPDEPVAAEAPAAGGAGGAAGPGGAGGPGGGPGRGGRRQGGP